MTSEAVVSASLKFPILRLVRDKLSSRWVFNWAKMSSEVDEAAALAASVGLRRGRRRSAYSYL